MRRLRSRSDVELFAAVPGDPDAFAEFYRRHEREVLRFFARWCRSSEAAADLMAETFAAAFESLPRFVPELGEPRAWLFGIAQNLLLRSIKRGRVENEARQRLGMEVLVLEDEALDRVEALASRRDVALAELDGLSEVVRVAVFGRVIEEREYWELAAALECSPSVVRQRVKRGLDQIRDRLGAEP